MDRGRLETDHVLDPKMRFWLIAAVLFVLPLPGPCEAAPNPNNTIVDPRACSPIPSKLDKAASQIVGEDWAVYKPNMCLYPAIAPGGKVVLDILSLDISKADSKNALVFKHGKPVDPDDVSGDFDPIPKPAVISVDGRLLATLREPFPNNDPATTSISFGDWHNGYPYKIIQYVNDPTQEAAHLPFCPPPYLWDATAQRYVEAKGDYYGACPKQ